MYVCQFSSSHVRLWGKQVYSSSCANESFTFWIHLGGWDTKKFENEKTRIWVHGQLGLRLDPRVQTGCSFFVVERKNPSVLFVPLSLMLRVWSVLCFVEVVVCACLWCCLCSCGCSLLPVFVCVQSMMFAYLSVLCAFCFLFLFVPF